MSDIMRNAVYEDIPRITEIWQSSFGDDKEYIDFFLSRRFDSVQILVFERDGTVISQLFLLPVSIAAVSGYYLYAAATDEKYRGLGIMAKLLGYAEKTASENGKDFIFLVPGEQRLYGYYKKHGYEASFSKNTVSLSRNELKELPEDIICSSSADDAIEFLKGFTGIVSWDSGALSYAIDEFLTYRGLVCTVKGKALLMYSKDRALIVSDEKYFSVGASMLSKLSDSQSFEITTPVPMGNRERGGMILKLTDRAKSISYDSIFVLFAKE